MELPEIIRRARRHDAHLVFLDESGFMLTPTVRRTFAPRGITPILHSWDRHDRISAISCVTVSPKRRRLGLYFYLMPDDRNVRGEDTVAFLKQLKRHMRGPMTIVWDRGNVHDRALVVRAYLAKHPEIATERLPAYTPEANPDEGVWGHTKYGRLAKFTPEDKVELRSAIVEELDALAGRQDLLAAFIRNAKVPDPPPDPVPFATLESVSLCGTCLREHEFSMPNVECKYRVCRPNTRRNLY